MSDEQAKMQMEIRYCLGWGYLPQAAWIATEFWSTIKQDMAITIVPVDEGRLEILLDGEMIFDRKAEGGAYPALDKVRALKQVVQGKMG